MPAGPRPQLAIIGLDGATWDVIDPLRANGQLPHIQSIIERGVHANLLSTHPPLTPVAWISFATGHAPPQHGIASWHNLRPRSYASDLATRCAARVPAFWEVLDDLGIKVGLLNIPMTYPPPVLTHGYAIAGFDAPSADRSLTAPWALFDEIEQRLGEFPFGSVTPDAEGYDLDRMENQLDLREQVAEYLIVGRPVDVFVMVHMETDHVSHWVWRDRAVTTKRGRVVDDALHHTYRLIDAAMGRLLNRLPEETTVILMSDHGSGLGDVDVDVNALLEKAGFLVRRRAEAAGSGDGRTRLVNALRQARRALIPKGMWHRLRRKRPGLDALVSSVRSVGHSVDWQRTLAFSWSKAGVIRLNVAGREPAGSVPRSRMGEVAAEIKQALPTVRLGAAGLQPVKEVLTREEAWPGIEASDVGADLIAIPDYEAGVVLGVPGATGWGARPAVAARGAGRPTGGHAPVGIFAAAGPMITHDDKRHEARIEDLAPTVLYLMDAPIPQSTYGCVMQFAVGEQVRATRGIRWTERQPRVCPDGTGYTEDQEQKVVERLRDLGYFE